MRPHFLVLPFNRSHGSLPAMSTRFRFLVILLLFLLSTRFCQAEIHEHSGFGKELPHEKYLRLVSEGDSPVQETYVKTKDSLITVDRILYDRLNKAGKPVRMEIYENGYHDFCIGPQGHIGYHQPLMDATLDALDLTLRWVRDRK